MSSRGNISLNFLISIFIFVFLLPPLVSCYKLIAYENFFIFEAGDELSLLQLRRILLLGYDFTIEDNSLKFIYHDADYQLKEVGSRLLLQPGTQIFLDNITDVSFVIKGNTIYLHYKKEDDEYERALSSKGLYLADFPVIDDELSIVDE